MIFTLVEISRLLRVNNEAKAEKFCAEVQKEFRTLTPSVNEIGECLNGSSNARRNPEIAAQLIRKRREKPSAWEQGKTVARGTPENTEGLIRRRPKKTGELKKGNSVIARSEWKDSGLLADTEPLPMRHDTRYTSKGIRKCRHGVPKTGLCHICRGGSVDD